MPRQACSINTNLMVTLPVLTDLAEVVKIYLQTPRAIYRRDQVLRSSNIQTFIAPHGHIHTYVRISQFVTISLCTCQTSLLLAQVPDLMYDFVNLYLIFFIPSEVKSVMRLKFGMIGLAQLDPTRSDMAIMLFTQLYLRNYMGDLRQTVTIL